MHCWIVLQEKQKVGFNSLREGGGIRDILDFCRKNGTNYAENTRESLRKYSVKYLVNAGLAIRNHDDPGRPTNSAKTNYILHPDFISIVEELDQNKQKKLIENWIDQKGVKISNDHWRADTSLIVEFGSHRYNIHPSPHNYLEKISVEKFLPVFTKHLEVIYFSDTDNKALHVTEKLEKYLGSKFDVHQKLPDVVAVDEKLGTIFYIEAVASAGEINALRREEIDRLFSNVNGLKKRYVSVFINRKDFRKFSDTIDVGTEAWIVEDYPQIVYFKALKTIEDSMSVNP